ncbi:MAG: LLM class flavin-dependent oxidoreductase [Deltaproteobacteria bacterium]|nr:LLM class flavin-dependent oxidoreductase [Deltaproteobacteria bacterium]
MTMTKRLRYWGLIGPMPAAELTATCRMFEAVGVDGLFAPQVLGPPWIPLAAAAAVTERVQIASGIAIAAARSPFETAMAALDLDRLSGGRFVLGLGTSVLAWTRGIFGSPVEKQVSHLRETVAAIRHIVAGAHVGLAPFEGEFYRADFRELQPMSPPVRSAIPIWIAALRTRMVGLAAEVGDGLIGHPMWSIEWTLERMRPDFEAALARARRRRDDVEVNLWYWAAPGPDVRQAIDDARPTMAFYGGVAQYEPFFAAHGFAEVARKLQVAVQRGDYRSAAALVPDEMVRTFVAVGERDAIRARFAPVASFADSLCVVPPVYALPPERVREYGVGIAEALYGS